MRKLEVDARLFTSKQELHSAMRTALGQENYWGSNLDALYDCLTSVCEPTRLIIMHWTAAMLKLGPYADGLWHVLDDASEANPAIEITLE